MQTLHVADVSDREVGKAFESLIATDLRYGSVVRFRASLSAFFGWCRAEMWPWDEAGLEAAYQVWRTHNERLAYVFLILGWTGLRWVKHGR